MTVPVATSTILPQAFRIMEVSPPSSYDDNSEKARAAREQYPTARDMVLERYDFSDSRWVVTLAQYTLSEARQEYPDPNLPFTVRLPDGMLKLRCVYDGDTFKWRKDGRLIRFDKDIETLTIRGSRRIEREPDMDATTRTLIAYQLAALLAPRFVTTRTKKVTIRNEMAEVASVAIANDAHTAAAYQLDGYEDGDWVEAATI